MSKISLTKFRVAKKITVAISATFSGVSKLGAKICTKLSKLGTVDAPNSGHQIRQKCKLKILTDFKKYFQRRIGGHKKLQ